MTFYIIQRLVILPFHSRNVVREAVELRRGTINLRIHQNVTSSSRFTVCDTIVIGTAWNFYGTSEE